MIKIIIPQISEAYFDALGKAGRAGVMRPSNFFWFSRWIFPKYRFLIWLLLLPEKLASMAFQSLPKTLMSRTNSTSSSSVHSDFISYGFR